MPFGDTPPKAVDLDRDEKVIEDPDESFTLGDDEPEPEPPDHVLEDDTEPEPEPEPDFDELPPPPVARPPRAPKAETPRAEVARAEPAPRRRPAAPPKEKDLVFDEEDPSAIDAAPVDTERGKLRLLGIYLVVIVGFYAVLWRMLIAEPALADRWLGSVPVVGPLATERLMSREISLTNLAGRYERIRQGRGNEVFIITGEATSNAPVPLHSVRIRGQALDASGNVLDKKTIYCGNAVSATILNDLSPREVTVLQQIQPPARFTIEPGVSKSFVIVFTEPPAGIQDFTAEVIGARR